MAAQLSLYPLLTRIANRAEAAPDALAITDVPHGVTVDYRSLAHDVVRLAVDLVDAASPAPGTDLQEQRVAILCDKGYLVPLSLLSIWAAGGFALPVLASLPLAEQRYLIDNADCALIICDRANRHRADELAGNKPAGSEPCNVLEMSLERIREPRDDLPDPQDSAKLLLSRPQIDGERRAMMLYTSGTTGRPKGAVTRHSALSAQVESIVTAWRWTEADNLLHILPLNHLHGICVALLPSLWAGAHVELWSKFDGQAIWKRWINEDRRVPVTMFFGVPTVYSRLITAHASLSPDEQVAATKGSASLRLQVSGSAPLPVSVKAAWERPGGVGGGQVLLERYGMTETGLIATTGWENDKRVGGYVGNPMPNVEIRLFDLDTNAVVDTADTPGEVQVRGPGITKEYWRLPDATAKEFIDGWFKTGDIAERCGAAGPAHNMYHILGRNSVDIIKSGGEKISAVEIERAILELPDIQDAAVVGVADEEWGQVVAACIVTSRAQLTLEQLRNELRSEIASFKLPRKLKVVDVIPRNGMGKIQKKQIVEQQFGPGM